MKAIDIVIIPPKDIFNLAIEISNSIASETIEPPILLNNKNQLPHISLLMGGAEDSKIDLIWSKIETLLEVHESTFNLEITELKKGDHNYSFTISRTPELLAFHNSLVEEIAPLLSYEVTEEHFTNSSTFNPRSADWVNNYIENSSGENFKPHITLGAHHDSMILGEKHLCSLEENLPIRFEVQHITLCHLGNYCTCAETIRSVS
ncbi:2'-5' RNA ligase family protein [Candidatus Dojkabacteria bacterium]|uniref:2'-5' RNA ligase family protein n=1 Tax=Candidatus Dojkabacteria bacterium TaxID=2099670 RepID=A0A955L9M0_9BACT|nr:2'-5' RNA ligase family protein [Candidatus Dojkabacteria bacterium]